MLQRIQMKETTSRTLESDGKTRIYAQAQAVLVSSIGGDRLSTMVRSDFQDDLSNTCADCVFFGPCDANAEKARV